MPYDGSGNFSRTMDWTNDQLAAIKIRADRHDQNDDDFAAGLGNVICKDGQTQITADISWNGKKLINLASPVSPQDAATKAYVDQLHTFTTGAEISGSDAFGRLRFTSPTGVNGIEWKSTDFSWLARIGVLNQSPNRLVLNDKMDGTGTDVFIISDSGRLTTTFGEYMHNLFWDGASWRTPVAGIATLIQSISGAFKLLANDVATTTAWLAPTLREFFRVTNTNGTTQLDLLKTASGKTNQVRSYMGTGLRWTLDLGNTVAEDSASAGSNFYLQSYNNAGTALPVMHAYRSSGDIIFYQNVAMQKALSITGTLTLLGPLSAAAETATFSIVSAQYFDANSSVYGGSGALYLRPTAYNSTTGQAVLSTSGDLTLARYMTAEGYQERSGTAGSYGGEFFNLYWNGALYGYINATNVGFFSLNCDYRIKKDVKPLASTWDKVKVLNPISYTQKDYIAEDGTHLFHASDEVRWGFLAHELQERLLPSAAFGKKDEANVIQGPDMMAIVAGLTAALQEAMVRIEALEAK